jgi:DNA-binding transcriptional MerR regulator
MTIDELARQAQLPVRTVREYHTLRLLPPPDRHGRVGVYDPGHLQRLELIARLQRRGYSLAGIRDLLQAWATGADLTSVLGIEPGPAALDEMPLRLTGPELRDRVPALTGRALAGACEAGLVRPDEDGFLVRSPALLALVADGTNAGIPVSDMLSLADTLRGQLGSLADTIAELIAERLMPMLRDGQNPGDIVPLLQRGRVLLLQAAASTLADKLAAALRQRSAGADGAGLRAALDQIRVGAVADGSGNIGYPGRDDQGRRAHMAQRPDTSVSSPDRI